MSERMHALAQHLLGKSSVDECSLEEVKNVAQRFPYFAPAQFLLLQKLRQLNAPEAEAQQRKAVLYYHDPLQFEYFMASDKFNLEDASWQLKRNTESSAPGTIDTIDAGRDTEVVVPKEASAFDFTNQPQIIEEENASAAAEQPGVAGEMADDLVETDAVEASPVVVETEEQATENTAAGRAPEGQTALPKMPALNIVAPSADTGLSFEPFHTVDYFASQGIKVTTDDLSRDKLGKQMRSFTEWLRMMKRLPAAEMAQKPESMAEKKVETMAHHSVTETDIVTEAMAEVWAKQGNKQKAIETYNKLSLLNPSKKAYFAAKIENLKLS